MTRRRKRKRPPTPERVEAAECPCCGQIIKRKWEWRPAEWRYQLAYRKHNAPCGLPCLTKYEAALNQDYHEVTEECRLCQDKLRLNKEGVTFPKNKLAHVVDPPEYKFPWNRLVITPHALKMTKIRGQFGSVVDAAMFIEDTYPLTRYNSSQREPQGTSWVKRNKKGKARKRSQKVDLYAVNLGYTQWIFYIKRNVLMTVHRNDMTPPKDYDEAHDNGCQAG